MAISLSGSLNLSGSLTTTGTITATTLVVQTITSSISSITGSTNFGSLAANTHTFTGSLNVTGSLAVVTTGTEFQVTNTGVNLGNALTDSHIISGSVRINPNGLFVSGSGRVGINTTNPLSLFDVAVLTSGERRLLVNYDDSLVTIKSANNSATAESLRVWGDNIYFYTGSAGSGGELMRLTNTGRVGIGTTTPSSSLDTITNSSGGNILNGTTDVVARFGNSNTNPGNHNSSGIQIFQGTGTLGSGYAVGFLAADNNTAIPQQQNTLSLITPTSMAGGINLIAADTSATIKFYTGGFTNERMRITSIGNLEMRPITFSGVANNATQTVLSNMGKGTWLVSVANDVDSSDGYSAMLWVRTNEIIQMQVFRVDSMVFSYSNQDLRIQNTSGFAATLYVTAIRMAAS